MTMHFFKLVTSDEEVRWLNLAMISRVTLAKDTASGKPVLAILFSDAAQENKLSITGNTKKNQQAIDDLVAELDNVARNG